MVDGFGWRKPVGVMAMLAFGSICIFGPCLGIVVWFQPDAHADLSSTVLGRLFMTMLGFLLIAASAALGIGMGRILAFRWLSRLVGERTTARVTGKSSVTDAEGDLRWTVRLSGVTSDGTGFAEEIGHGSKEPPDFGTTMAVRYHRRTGVNLERRTVGGFLEALIMDSFIAAVGAAGLYSAGLISYGIVAIWI